MAQDNNESNSEQQTYVLQVWWAVNWLGMLGYGSLGQTEAVLHWSLLDRTITILREGSNEVIFSGKFEDITKASFQLNMITLYTPARKYTLYVRNATLDAAYLGALPFRLAGAVGVVGGAIIANRAHIDTLESILTSSQAKVRTFNVAKTLRFAVLAIIAPFAIIIALVFIFGS